jgi:hypothetical protein
MSQNNEAFQPSYLPTYSFISRNMGINFHSANFIRFGKMMQKEFLLSHV